MNEVAFPPTATIGSTLTRGPAGRIGKGRPGRNLRRLRPDGVPLRAFARDRGIVKVRDQWVAAS